MSCIHRIGTYFKRIVTIASKFFLQKTNIIRLVQINTLKHYMPLSLIRWYICCEDLYIIYNKI